MNVIEPIQLTTGPLIHFIQGYFRGHILHNMLYNGHSSNFHSSNKRRIGPRDAHLQQHLRLLHDANFSCCLTLVRN